MVAETQNNLESNPPAGSTTETLDREETGNINTVENATLQLEVSSQKVTIFDGTKFLQME